ncbi:aspartate--tRNA ligase, partial [Candidatus Falkowbacteria bacterium RIFOXYB2_FULL_38_15]
MRTLIKDTINKVGEEVLLKGWVHTRRDMGKIIFIDLRDSSGLIQVVFASKDPELVAEANKLRSEFVLAITGEVKARPEKMVNPKIATGTVEILVKKLEILNEAKTLPFEIDKDTSVVNEELRMKYRYLDIRSERVKNNIILRSKITREVRNFLNDKGFFEIETPYLTKGTPEGAREYIVPSRVQPGKFYVLPQSPQQFKQLLMVGGIEKYFQVARCFRDEDSRGDRQPEFTQIDMEMSFVGQEDVMQLTEEMIIEIVKKITPEKTITKIPFPILTYQEAMEKYKTDKPDLREDKDNPNELAFCWVVDFPLFEWSESDKKLNSSHHPFTMPQKEDLNLLDEHPLDAKAYAYDIALNGYEVGGGSIRIHDRNLQSKIFRILGVGKDEAEER